MFIPCKYLITYYAIINRAIKRDIDDVYEIHHIIPRSMGGSNKKENLVKLTPREHFICHKILVKITEGDNRKKMSYALWRMCNGKHDFLKISIRYDFARKSFLEARKNREVSNETREKLSLAHKGKPKPNSKWPTSIKELNGRTALWEVTTPTGEVLIVEGLSKYCKENNIDQCNISTYGKSKGYLAKKIGEYTDIKNRRLLPLNFAT